MQLCKHFHVCLHLRHLISIKQFSWLRFVQTQWCYRITSGSQSSASDIDSEVAHQIHANQEKLRSRCHVEIVRLQNLVLHVLLHWAHLSNMLPLQQDLPIHCQTERTGKQCYWDLASHWKWCGSSGSTYNLELLYLPKHSHSRVDGCMLEMALKCAVPTQTVAMCGLFKLPTSKVVSGWRHQPVEKQQWPINEIPVHGPNELALKTQAALMRALDAL